MAAAILASSMLAGACGTEDDTSSAFGVELSFDPSPRVGDTTCSIRLTDARGVPLSGASIEIEGNMNHAGMVPVFGRAHERDVGEYEAPLEFTMGGDWFVIVRVDPAQGTSFERIVEVPGVAQRDRVELAEEREAR